MKRVLLCILVAAFQIGCDSDEDSSNSTGLTITPFQDDFVIGIFFLDFSYSDEAAFEYADIYIDGVLVPDSRQYLPTFSYKVNSHQAPFERDATDQISNFTVKVYGTGGFIGNYQTEILVKHYDSDYPYFSGSSHDDPSDFENCTITINPVGVPSEFYNQTVDTEMDVALPDTTGLTFALYELDGTFLRSLEYEVSNYHDYRINCFSSAFPLEQSRVYSLHVEVGGELICSGDFWCLTTVDYNSLSVE